MSFLVDILIVVLLFLAAYSGTRRGAVLIALEFLCFTLATVGGFLLYRPVGAGLGSFGLSRSLANVTAFTLIWVFVEVASAVAIRLVVLRHISRIVQISRLNQIGGSVLNIAKYSLLIGLALIVVAALPVSDSAKGIITKSLVAKQILASTTNLQHWLGGGLGHDIGDSLNFYTISAAPESTEHVDLGFKTTGTINQTDEDDMLVLINQERKSRGIAPLTLNAEARTVARAYSLRMFADGYFSHIDPDGHNPFERLSAAGVHFGSAGENLALAPTLAQAHQGLMNSPGHKANILSTNYRRVGIGVVDGGQYGLMITQDFTD